MPEPNLSYAVYFPPNPKKNYHPNSQKYDGGFISETERYMLNSQAGPDPCLNADI